MAARGEEEAPIGPVLLGRTQELDGGGERRPNPLQGATKAMDDVKPGEAEEVLTQKGDLPRSGSFLQRAGTQLQRASTNLTLQRANTLPTEDKELRHAATMPMLFDTEADRPWCGGLWKTQQLIGFLLGVALAVGFCIARPIKTYPQANDMLGITVLCACFWVFEVIPVYMTALFPLVLMPFLKVTSSEVAAQGYWDWISLLVVGTCLMGIALEEVQLPKRVALLLLLRVGVASPSALLGCFMAISWVLGMFVNNVAATMLLAPFAISLMRAAEEQAREAELAASPEAAQEEGGSAHSGDGVGEAAARKVGEGTEKEVQRLAECLLLGIAYGATSGGMATLTGAIANYLLAGGAVEGVQVTYGSWLSFALPISMVTLALGYAVLWLRYLPRLSFRGLSHQVLEGEYEDFLAEAGPLSRDEVLVGLAQLAQVALFLVRPFAISPHVATRYGANLVDDATLACMPTLLLFFIPSVVRPGKALLTWPAVHEKFDFGLLLLIGGGLALKSGFIQSGLNVAMGSALARIIPHVGVVLLNFIIIVCVALSSQVLSSIGTAAAMQPVLASAALQAVVNPLSLMLPATIAVSIAFMLPTATPANVVILAKSQELPRPLRIRDFCINGLPLTVLACVVAAVLVAVMGSAVFQSSDPFPQWACGALPANCLWVAIPGSVQGKEVVAQACIVAVGDLDGSVCQLWNGTVLNTSAYSTPM